MKHQLTCPGCKLQFTIEEDYEFGHCTQCNNWEYYWEDGWNYLTEEKEQEEGYEWIKIHN